MFWFSDRQAPQPLFERLEDRLLFAAQPVVTVEATEQALVGETAQATVTFSNVPDSNPGSDVGYSPYVDLIVPTRGADGHAPGTAPADTYDGLTFNGATLQGQALQSFSVVFDADGNATHPFARDTSGQLRVVHAADYGAQPGDTLVSVQLPFGSFTPDQPAIPIDVQFGVSPLADIEVPLTLSAVGGFAFGRDSLNNPTADAPVVGPIATDTVTPTLALISKNSDLPESETATGPSYPHHYTITIDIAEGQTIDNLAIEDLLPNGVVVQSVTAPGATITQSAGSIVATYANPVTGVAGTDLTLQVTFYVGETLAPDLPGVPVLNPLTGGSRALENNVTATADWTPVDPRDAPQQFVADPDGPENVIVAKALAVQKTSTIVSGSQTGIPGDTIEWTIRLQVSDYFNLDALTLNDLLSDGQSFATGFVPTLSIQEQGVVIGTATFDAANYSAIRSGATTNVVFEVGDEMVLRGLDSILQGGGGAAPAPTEIVIVFRTVVDSTYSTGAPVLHDDTVTNSVSADATIVPSGNPITDNSDAAVPITPGQLDGKSVYAINGQPVSGPNPLVADGDVVTFRLQYTLPSQSTADFVLTDFLPLPIFTAAGIVFQDRIDATAPPAGFAWFGPTDTLDAANPLGYAGAPTLVIDTAGNSISFDYGDLTFSPSDGTLHVDILFSVVVQDEPFGDGLLFTNVLQGSEANSSGSSTFGIAGSQVTLSQPELTLEKGIVASSNPDATFAPSDVAPVSFTAPGSAGVRFSGTLNSNVLSTGEITSDVSQIDGGDLVTFAIVVENTGSGRDGAHSTS